MEKDDDGEEEENTQYRKKCIFNIILFVVLSCVFISKDIYGP